MTLVKTKTVHRLPAAHKQRLGLHHRQSHHYIKTYWPYLPIALVVTVGILMSQLLWQSHRSVLGYATDMSVQSLFDDTNAQRAIRGENTLAINQALDSAAQAKANDMATHDYWSHDTPDGKTPWSFIAAAGYNYQAAGENLAYGFATATDTTAGWMNSPEHRANLLNTSYLDVGFGIANAPHYQGSAPETIVVAMYATPENAAVAAAAPSTQPNVLALTTTVPFAQTSATNHVAEPASLPIARMQLLAVGTSSLALGVAIVVGAVGFGFLLLRHSRRWHKAVVRGEAFVLHHPLLDIGVVILVTAAIVLTRTAGFIR